MLPLTQPLILASASPRRAALLTQIGLPFRVAPAHVEEPAPRPHEDVVDWAQQAALAKARAAACFLPDAPVLVLGADTVVVLPHAASDAPLLHGSPVRVLGKPRDGEDARAMLRALSGRAHTVLSAFALVEHPEGQARTGLGETRVHMRALTEAEIAAYVASGEPLDKAGAYGIQEQGAVLIDHIEGDYFTVVGLPLTQLWLALAPWRA